eukprot:2206007-Rhodomonas_salina.3
MRRSAPRAWAMARTRHTRASLPAPAHIHVSPWRCLVRLESVADEAAAHCDWRVWLTRLQHAAHCLTLHNPHRSLAPSLLRFLQTSLSACVPGSSPFQVFIPSSRIAPSHSHDLGKTGGMQVRKEGGEGRRQRKEVKAGGRKDWREAGGWTSVGCAKQHVHRSMGAR